MAKITIDWENHRRNLIRLVLEAGWQGCDLYSAIDQVNSMADSVNHTVYLLMVPGCQQVYSPPGMIGHFTSLHRSWHAQIAFCIHVLPQFRQRYEFQILYSLDKHASNYHLVVQSIDEAYDVLNSHLGSGQILA